MPGLCRQCDNWFEERIGACPSCGSERVIFNEDLERLSIAHIDCDAFFAAIEKRDNPELRDRPVVVGGGKRGVVSTCCYIARLHGVRSAMPMFKALKACPEAVVVKSRFGPYTEASRQIRELLLTLTPLVQMVSIDEAYLDLSGTQSLNQARPAQVLSRLARQIEQDIGITVSIGLSENKFLAKTASEFDKPRGYSALSKNQAVEYLAPLPLSAIHGVGKQLEKKLNRQGFYTIADVQRTDVKGLIRKLGETGLWLHKRANGIDNRPVRNDGERKSVSSERTFAQDISDLSQLEDRLWGVCEDTANRAKKVGVEGATVTLKLKTTQFRSLTRSITLTSPTQLAQTLFRTARPLLQKETGAGKKYRLIGVGLSQLRPATGDTKDLVDPKIEKRAAAERAGDKANAKFGGSAVVTGRSIRSSRRKKPTP